jgi:hypothetical protein
MGTNDYLARKTYMQGKKERKRERVRKREIEGGREREK